MLNEYSVLRLQANFKLFLMEKFPSYNFEDFKADLMTDEYKYNTIFKKEDSQQRINIKYYLYKSEIVHWCLCLEEETYSFYQNYSKLDIINHKSDVINDILNDICKMDLQEINKTKKIIDMMGV